MTKPPSPPLALTLGEPGGVAGEIAAKAWRRLQGANCHFCLFGDPAYAAQYGPVATIAAPEYAASAFADALPIIDIATPVKSEPGVASPATASAVIGSIEQAVAAAVSGAVAAVVTNPIQKSALQAAGFGFPGHTEFLGALTTTPDATPEPIMMLAGPALRTVPVTVHQSVRSAAQDLTSERIVAVATIVDAGLRSDFGVAAPRLAISGLNPHAGEDGVMGDEDRSVIAPAIAALRQRGIDATGPHPADTLFHAAARQRYDAAICMLHDQALIPVKTLDFDNTVNVTLGLPIVRTSPDHGTALDIAGKNVAREDSLVAALRLAKTLSDARRAGANA